MLILTLDYTFWDGEGPSVMHIDGLALEDPDKDYTQILTGSWEFELGGVDRVEAITYPTNKLSYECVICLRWNPWPTFTRNGWRLYHRNL